MAPPRRPKTADAPAPGPGAPARRSQILRAWRANRARLTASALVVLTCAVLLGREREAIQAAVAATANLFACWQFASTLAPGREPLISRYTRFDFGRLPPDLDDYTRRLTLLWAVLLAGFAAAQAAVLATGAHASASAVLAAEIAACGALFLGEHFVRNARFPHHRPVSLRRTLRAVRLAYAVGHGGGVAIPLTARPPTDVLCWRGGRPVSVGRFLAEAAALAARLPDRPYAVNLCADRYLALLGFAAALSRGQTTLLCADRSPLRLRALAARYPDAHAVADGPPLEHAAWPVTPPDGLAEAGASGIPAPRIPARHVAAIAFTSGSTGEPEAHAKPWGALVSGAEAAAERFGLRASDGPPAATVATVPPQHMYGFETTVMLPLHSAAAQVAGETFFPSDVAEALAAVPARRVLVTTPLQLRALLAAGTAPATLSAVVSATAPLSAALAEAVEQAWNVPVLEIYGATEAGSMASRRTVLDPDWLPYRVVSLHPGGVSVDGIGPVPLADALEACADPLRAGRFRLLGRQSDVVKLGGRRASLAELNRVLLGVEGVEDGAFLAPDDLESNPASRLSAFVVAPTRTPGAIIGALRGRMEPVFLPRPVVMVPALPRDRLGKLPRRALLELRRAAAK